MFLLLIYCILIYYFSVPHPSNIFHFPTPRKTPAAGIAIALFQASCAAVSTAGPARCRPTRPPPPRCRRRPAASTTRSTSSSNRGGSSGVGGRPADRRPGDQLPVGLHSSLTQSLSSTSQAAGFSPRITHYGQIILGHSVSLLPCHDRGRGMWGKWDCSSLKLSFAMFDFK